MRNIAGFWRRLGAFCVDALILGLIGAGAGLFLTDVFVRLGVWGRLPGFFVALMYFGCLNSRLTGGQTPGKRLLQIKVVDKAGAPLNVARSGLRYLPLAIPWFLNNAPLPASIMLSPWMYVFAVAIFGIGLSAIYLLVFNRSSRQSLHDIAVGSYVVSTEAPGPVCGVGTPRAHLWVCGALIAACAAVPYVAGRLADSGLFASILSVQRSVNAEPWIAYAKVHKGKQTKLGSQGGRSMSYLSVVAHVVDSDIRNEDRARRLATLALNADNSAMALDAVQITLVYGYDIGIASAWTSHTISRTPAEWLAR